MIGIFENFSKTSEKPGSKFLPIIVKGTPNFLFYQIVKKLEEMGFAVTANNNYYDIFHVDGGFEITYILCADDSGNCIINFTVYSEHKRGRTRGKLKKEIMMLKSWFN